MPLSEIIILGYIVAFFSAFVIAIGGVSGWIALSDYRDGAAKRRRVSFEPRQADHHGELLKAA